MDPVRRAIASKLLADPAVTGKLAATNAVYHRHAPPDAIPPYVILHRQTGTDRDWTFDGQALTEDVWVVKGIDRSSQSRTSSTAEDIAAAIHASLHYADLTITGYTLGTIRRTVIVDYGEPDGAEHYAHVGGIYQLELTPTS